MEKEKILSIIAENIRSLMNKGGISNTALARECKISTGTVSKVLSGSMSITLPMAVTLANGLRVDLKELLAGLTTEESLEKFNKADIKKSPGYSIGILSINNQRITCIKDLDGNVVGTSELIGGLDLAATTANLMHLIQEAIKKALPNHITSLPKLLRASRLNLVMQSYEFEDTRFKFILFAKKYFQEVVLLSDWQITYFATFANFSGISLIVDKGVSLSYFSQGHIKKLGGWKFPICDFGGENWLGAETVRHTIEAVEGYVPMSVLASNVLSHFEGRIEKIIETCFKGSKDPDIYCSFAEILLRNYLMGDLEAKAIIDRGFQLIYKSIEHVDRLLGMQLRICLNGSLTNIYKKFIDPNRLITSLANSEKVNLLANITTEFLKNHGIRTE